MLDTFRQDVQYAVRGLVRSPLFALTAILSLAIGVGGTVSLVSDDPHAGTLRRAHGNPGGGLRRFVACSNANASVINFGSLQAPPVKLMP